MAEEGRETKRQKLRKKLADERLEERRAKRIALRQKLGGVVSPRKDDPRDFLEADPTAASVAARGAVRGLFGVAQLFNMIDPFAPIKRKFGHETQTELFEKAAVPALKEIGIDLEQVSPRGRLRLIEKGAEELSAGAIPSTAVFRVAKRSKQTGRVLGPFLKNIASRPGRFAASEAASITGSALARTAASDEPGAQIAAGVLGGVGPGMFGGSARLAGKTARGVGRRLTKRGRFERGMDLAAKTAQEQTSDIPRALRNIDEADELATAIPGLEASGAQATRDPGLLGLESATATDTSKLNLQLQLSREQGQASVVTALADEVGDVASDREIASAVVEAQERAVAHALDEQIEISRRNIEAAVEAGTGGRRSADISELARLELEREAESVFEPLSRQYDDIDAFADDIQATFDATPIRDAIVEVKKTSTRAEGIALPRDLVLSMEELGIVSVAPGAKVIGVGGAEAINLADVTVKANVPVPFRELRGLNRRLNREISSARVSREAISKGSTRALGALKKGTKRVLDAVEDSSEFPELARNYRLTNDQFTAAAIRFREGVIGQVLEPQRRPPAATATMGFFFKSGKGAREAAQQYKAAAVDSPELTGLMNDYIVSEAWNAVSGPEGKLHRRSLQVFIRKHGDALAEFPEARDRVSRLDNLVSAADERGLAKTRGLAEFQEDVASTFTGSKDVRSAVNSILRSDDPVRAARELRTQLAGDPDAIEGAARVFWRELQRRALRHGDLGVGVNPYLEPQTFTKLAEEFMPIIRVLHGEDHARRLQILVDGAELAFAGRIPKTARNVQRSLTENLSAAFLYAQLPGTRVKVARGLVQIGRFFKNLDLGETSDLLESALVNRSIMRTLLTRVTKKNERLIIRRLRSHLFSLGHRATIEDDTEPDSRQGGT
jgi:hypothetical protein